MSKSDWTSLSVPSVHPSVENALSSAADLESCCSWTLDKLTEKKVAILDNMNYIHVVCISVILLN